MLHLVGDLFEVLLSVCFLSTSEFVPKLKEEEEETHINVTETSPMNPSLS
jgi:hypothetical protein